ncbi:choline dehydrogenase [Granulosicoccus antarcticus]|uniref:Choline dehydrogenase n=1 Tax=Granulosicoccus antarcticus IMCC3135 TaxID=1192854 RepID=A0A2Z2NVN5_9GAMM|nr:choline dehydrogenase [Granulosicoccus antarcticus]ASJ75399.1 Oxygen-dependent choline dehydrogenase [Granulosicoccus antarcticus IMCC3135]
MIEFDYVIVGAGSAGCVLAARLSEDPSVSVALLEAGGDDGSLLIRMPTALSIPMNMKKYNWGFESDPEPGLDGRRMDCPRGKVIGGSSSINGMAFVRGHACDIDEWEEAGATGWNYANCLPYYKRMEAWHHGENRYRGGDGPVGVNGGNDMRLNPLYQAFIDAGEDAGYPFTADYNGYQQEGFGQKNMSIAGGQRASASRSYLKPIRGRSNLKIIPRVVVDQVIMEGTRAIGVSYRTAGRQMKIFTRGEVILSAGSIGSPAILQRSGIGPVDVLSAADVPVVIESPGVGANLQDHLEVYFQYKCTQPISLNRELSWWRKGLIGARWVFTKQGLGATNHFESCGFIRSRAGLKWPNVQYHFLPGAMRYDGRAAFAGDGFQVHVGPNKPRSRGHVAISSADPFQPPKIQFNYLQDKQDIQDWRDCIRLTREVLQQKSLAPFRGDEIQPGFDVESDESIDRWVKANVESAYHPSCTVKMGADNDPMAVLDQDCRVRGAQGLRVVDSSIFPSITNGNLNAPSMMVAERAADLIRGKSLPAEDAPVWEPDDWRNLQRSKTGHDRKAV